MFLYGLMECKKLLCRLESILEKIEKHEIKGLPGNDCFSQHMVSVLILWQSIVSEFHFPTDTLYLEAAVVMCEVLCG